MLTAGHVARGTDLCGRKYDLLVALSQRLSKRPGRFVSGCISSSNRQQCLALLTQLLKKSSGSPEMRYDFDALLTVCTLFKDLFSF